MDFGLTFFAQLFELLIALAALFGIDFGSLF